MELAFSAAEEAFRQTVRAFFITEYPADILRKNRAGLALTREEHMRAQAALQAPGWLGTGWPKEFGGPGFTPAERFIFEEELELAGAPAIIPMGIMYIGPIICAFGTAEQQARWLPATLAGDIFWAQGYSEPNAGSDLASLRTKAARAGDDYIVNGEKIWTTLGHWANWIFCLVRTSAETRKQDGITMLCVDMRTPGVEVHPIITMDGSHELNRVSFTDVRVPVANRIGAEGRGWFYANELLKHERLSYAHIGRKKADLARLRALRGAGAPDPRRLAALDMELAALEIFVLRGLSGSLTPAAISALKILSTELAQKITALFLETRGARAMASPAARTYLFERAQTIYGGASEIQKTIIFRELSRGV